MTSTDGERDYLSAALRALAAHHGIEVPTVTVYATTDAMTEDYNQVGWNHDDRIAVIEQAAIDLGYDLVHHYVTSPEWAAVAEAAEIAGTETYDEQRYALDRISDRADAIMGVIQ